MFGILDLNGIYLASFAELQFGHAVDAFASLFELGPAAVVWAMSEFVAVVEYNM